MIVSAGYLPGGFEEDLVGTLQGNGCVAQLLILDSFFDNKLQDNVFVVHVLDVVHNALRFGLGEWDGCGGSEDVTEGRKLGYGV